jgi:hypothetical protein
MEPFWQKAILQAIGPLVGALVGTLVIGMFAARITRRAQQRLAANQLREQLVTQMTEVASALYLQTQRHWRAKRRRLTDAELERSRAELDEQYHRTRVAGEVLESRLRILFGAATRRGSDEPRRLWHGVMDLLTVRYFDLIEEATDSLRQQNAGPQHSGLSAQELRDMGAVLRAYRVRLYAAIHAVLRNPIVPVSGPVMGGVPEAASGTAAFETSASEDDLGGALQAPGA